jgi:hypothetical protein
MELIRIIIVFLTFELVNAVAAVGMTSLMRNEIDNPKVECNNNEKCMIEFQMDDGVTYQYDLTKSSAHSIFAQDLQIFHDNEILSRSKQEEEEESQYHTINDGKIGTASIDLKKQELKHGIFVTNKHGTIEFHRELKTSSMNGNRNLRQNRRRLFSNLRDALYVDPILFVNPAIPGDCYPDDNSINVAQISFIADYGFVEQAIGGETNPSTQRTLVLTAIEDVFSLARLIWAVQLNIRLQVTYLEIASMNSPIPLSYNPRTGCGSTYDSFSRLFTYVNTVNPNGKWAGGTFLISQCYSGNDVDGFASVGSFCYPNGGGGVALSHSDPVTVAHELGHMFGSEHSLENGPGTTGGIMDVSGSGVYLNSQQIHPGRRPELCSALRNVKTVRNCGFFYSLSSSDTCGDGILASNEECECPLGLDRTPVTQCGDCINCKLENDADCSTVAAVRQPTDIGYVQVKDTMLATNQCCINGRVPIAQTCNGGQDVCMLGGYCIPVCTTLGYSPCGINASGCRQRCMILGLCTEVHPRLALHGSILNAVLGGTTCLVDPGASSELGRCNNGDCYGTINGDPGAKLTKAPTTEVKPLTDPPTKAPILEVSTKSPTIAPTPSVQPPGSTLCNSLKRKPACMRRLTCIWNSLTKCQLVAGGGVRTTTVTNKNGR